MKKVIAYLLIGILIANIALMAFGVISPLAFWIILGFGALSSYFLKKF